MQKTIIVLSDCDSAPFDARAGFEAAACLRRMGTKRADIAQDPRFVNLTETHKAYGRPVADFDKAAHLLAETVFRPLLEGSDVIDLARAARPAPEALPDMPSLSTVGRLFAQSNDIRLPADMAVRHGAELGLVFHLALKGPASKAPYTAMLFPSLPCAAREILRGFGKGVVGDTAARDYGPLIDLLALRKVLEKLGRAHSYARIGEEGTRPRYLS